MANLDRQNRAPDLLLQPDSRLRVTRRWDIANNKLPNGPVPTYSEIWQPWGTQDEVYVNCRLVKQFVSGQNDQPFRKPVEEPPYLTRVFDEIPANDRVMVGEPGISYDQYGRKIVVIEYVQFSAGTAIYSTAPGSTAAPVPNNDCILQSVQSSNDGTLITSKLTFIDSGILADNEELKFDGKLKLRTIRALNEIPATPAGYTLVTTSTEYVEGLKVYSYGFAAGGGGGGTGTGGEISRDIRYGQSSDLGVTGTTTITIDYLTDSSVDVNPIPTPSGFILIDVKYADETGYRLWTATYAKGIGEVARDISYSQTDDGGTTGVTVTSITHLTASSVSANPTTPPAGSTLIKLDHREADGYRIWTVVYGAGTGMVVLDTDIRQGGHLYIYHRVGLNGAPDAPSPTIGGTVTLIQQNERLADGYTIYDYQWAEGMGVISEDTTYQQSSDGGTTGVTVTTIRQLSSLATASNPITPPGGMALISVDYADQDGYRLWTGRWASGTGTVDSSTEQKDGDTLVLYRIVALGAPASTPAATIGGTVNPTGESVREDNGYQVFTNTWAEGEGLNVDSRTVSESGALVVYRRRAYGTPPSTPSATIGGTVTVVELTESQGDGYTIYDYRWAEGDGQASIQVQGEADGALVYTVTDFNAAPATPAYPGSGTAYLISLDQAPSAGFYRNRAVYKKPPASRTFRKTTTFTVPGLAAFVGGPPQLTILPPVTRTLLAEVEVTYDESQIEDLPYTVEFYAALNFAYVPAAEGSSPVSSSQALGSYLAGASSISGTNDFFNGVLCEYYEATLVSSSPDARPTGETLIDVDNDPYLVATDGTVVYRRTTVTVDLD